ncbi:hypothetical protein HSX10_09215 [Winogradskyella undariae]|uniref:hypothetical protein n=1 Tax=Winogradskyella undariae TaxID=1285465 RepID=UPI00156B39CE|nr:hypothetical protein [Winogradskyella undariae]NRR91741.1 hypothetical protein [Winogradskyella undariae]
MKLKSLLVLPVLFLCLLSFSQNQTHAKINYPNNVDTPLTKKEKSMIEEVYQLQAQEMVYDNESFLKDIKHLLRNRILIYEDVDPKTQKKGKLLSNVPLFKTYNKNLKRDTKFNVENFNPLKYQLDFFANGTYVYQIDNTNYFIQVTSQYRKFK